MSSVVDPLYNVQVGPRLEQNFLLRKKKALSHEALSFIPSCFSWLQKYGLGSKPRIYLNYVLVQH